MSCVQVFNEQRVRECLSRQSEGRAPAQSQLVSCVFSHLQLHWSQRETWRGREGEQREGGREGGRRGRGEEGEGGGGRGREREGEQREGGRGERRAKEETCTCIYTNVRVHVNKSKQGKANGSTQGRQLISKKKAELP